jgi:UPF0755 protein
MKMPHPSPSRKTSGFKKVLLTVLVLGVLALGAVAAVGAWAWHRLQQPYRAYPGEEVTVLIESGTGAGRILNLLEEEGVLRDAALSRRYLIHVLGDPPLKAGEYRFTEPLNVPAVLDKLIRGEVLTHPVTVLEGLSWEETAALLAAAGFGDESAFRAAIERPAAIAELDPAAENLEGYLFPDTYHFARGTSEEAIIAKMVATFRRHYRDTLEGIFSGEGKVRTVRQLVTLASIVEKEALLDEERPIIAGVYANRLRQGIGLYADPTVIYALKLAGRWDGNLRRADLAMDSPYNTYRYPGLPPGPIASPGLASLVAAAQPAAVDYLYFVSRNDGSHVFARTLAEHNRNVYRWQKQYWRDQWAKERREREEN